MTDSPLNAAPAAEIAPTAIVAEPAVGNVVSPEPAKVDPSPEVKVEPAKVDPEKSPLSQEKKPEEVAAPIKYEFKIPEGLPQDLKFDEAKLTTFNEIGNKLKLAPEAAQELFDFHASEMKSVVESITKAVTDNNVKAYNDLIGGWKTELSADPELSGANADKAHEILGKVLDSYGSKEARDAFDLTGAGWNPAIVRMMVKMGKALTEGGPGPQGKPVGQKDGPKTPGSVFYPAKQN